MSWKDRSQVEAPSDWKNRSVVDQAASTENPLVSGVRQFAQGASGNFSDELAGLVEGAGRALGVDGAGGPMKDISLSQDGMTSDWDILKDAYKRGRDKERGSLEKDKKDNPTTSFVANMGGAVMSPLNKMAAGLSPALLGATQGLGASNADLTEGDVGGALKDTAIGTAIGGLAGKIVPKAGAAVQNAVEDVATAPMTQAGAQMGPLSRGIGAIGKAGNAFDDLTSSMTAATGNPGADQVLNQLAKKSAYLIPGIGKVAAAADAAKYAPAVAQKGAQLALRGAEKSGLSSDMVTRGAINMGASRSPTTQSFDPEKIVQNAQGTKYGPVLQDAMKRGPHAVRAANFVLQGRDPEYRKLSMGDDDPSNHEREGDGS